MKSHKTGRQRTTNLNKLKRTQASLAVRRAVMDLPTKAAGGPAKKPEMQDFRATRGAARYKPNLLTRIKNWFRNTFSKKSAFPEID